MNLKIDPKTTGAFILQLRKEHGLTQKQLADQLGITDKAISRWETGKGYPDIEMLVSIGEVFSVSVNELLCGERSVETETAEKAVAGAYIDTTVKKRRLSVLTVIMVAFLLISLFSLIIGGSYNCVIAYDYSYMTLFGERYVPIMISNDDLRPGDVLISQARIQGAPAWEKLFFDDTVYTIRTIPNNEIVYLMTDYQWVDSHYYCMESQLGKYKNQFNVVPLV